MGEAAPRSTRHRGRLRSARWQPGGKCQPFSHPCPAGCRPACARWRGAAEDAPCRAWSHRHCRLLERGQARGDRHSRPVTASLAAAAAEALQLSIAIVSRSRAAARAGWSASPLGPLDRPGTFRGPCGRPGPRTARPTAARGTRGLRQAMPSQPFSPIARAAGASLVNRHGNAGDAVQAPAPLRQAEGRIAGVVTVAHSPPSSCATKSTRQRGCAYDRPLKALRISAVNRQGVALGAIGVVVLARLPDRWEGS